LDSVLGFLQQMVRNHPKKGKNPKEPKPPPTMRSSTGKDTPTVLIKMDGGLGFLLDKVNKALKVPRPVNQLTRTRANLPTPLPSPRARKKRTALGSPPCGWKTGIRTPGLS
jgi:hypothetical protein